MLVAKQFWFYDMDQKKNNKKKNTTHILWKFENGMRHFSKFVQESKSYRFGMT